MNQETKARIEENAVEMYILLKGMMDRNEWERLNNHTKYLIGKLVRKIESKQSNASIS